MRVSRLASWLAILGISIVTPGAAAASLDGAVFDPTDLPISNAQVALRPQSPAKTFRKVQTDAAGKFVFSDLAPGEYVLTIEARGFQIWEADLQIEDEADVHVSKAVLQIALGCGYSVKQPSRAGLILARVKRFFTQSRPAIQICQ